MPLKRNPFTPSKQLKTKSKQDLLHSSTDVSFKYGQQIIFTEYLVCN